ncbi:MAG: hypothetical protein ACREYC_14315 [Gammaproteobacteria bacterium]
MKLLLHAPSPDPLQLDQAFLPGIIPDAGIPPMLRLVDWFPSSCLDIEADEPPIIETFRVFAYR